MTKLEIQKALTQSHLDFVQEVENMDASAFMFSFPDKWTNGQQLEHLERSSAPVGLALLLPKFVLKLLFKTANRPSKSYEQLVQKYKDKIQAGGKASGRFVPPKVDFVRKNALCKKLLLNIQKINERLASFSESDLDYYLLPHPLLGKLTLREMLYFTIYHAQHHQKLLAKKEE